MKEVCSSETLVPTYKSTRRNKQISYRALFYSSRSFLLIRGLLIYELKAGGQWLVIVGVRLGLTLSWWSTSQNLRFQFMQRESVWSELTSSEVNLFMLRKWNGCTQILRLDLPEKVLILRSSTEIINFLADSDTLPLILYYWNSLRLWPHQETCAGQMIRLQ
jgi:hypothetical protein